MVFNGTTKEGEELEVRRRVVVHSAKVRTRLYWRQFYLNCSHVRFYHIRKNRVPKKRKKRNFETYVVNMSDYFRTLTHNVKYWRSC